MGPISLISSLAKMPLAFVDVETTGASAEWGDRVIELGIARVEGGRVTATYQQLIDPRRRVGPGITALTGISQEMVEGMPTFSEAATCALDFLRGCVLVGHNVPFDLGFLRHEFRRAGIDLAAELGASDSGGGGQATRGGGGGVHVLDTVRLARNRFGRGGSGLQSLAARFTCGEPAAHRALADALTTFRVMSCLLAPLGGWSITLMDAIKAQGGIIRIEGKSPRAPLPLELEEALGAAQPVEMEYVDIKSSRTTRIITPLEVRRFRNEMILLAWCALRNERRTFKIDRIVRLTRLDPESQALPYSAERTEPPAPASRFTSPAVAAIAEALAERAAISRVAHGAA